MHAVHLLAAEATSATAAKVAETVNARAEAREVAAAAATMDTASVAASFREQMKTTERKARDEQAKRATQLVSAGFLLVQLSNFCELFSPINFAMFNVAQGNACQYRAFLFHATSRSHA